MAIDRAVDSSFLDGGLNNIASAIRDKTGKSDFLAFPDDFVTEISGITGGGGNFNFSSLGDVNCSISGSFTPTSNTSAFILRVALDFTPKICILYTESILSDTNLYFPLALIQANISVDTGFILGVWTKGFTSFYLINPSYYKPFNFNATEDATNIDKVYGFNNDTNIKRICSVGENEVFFRPSSPRPSSISGYFENGSIYKYTIMGVK